VRRWAIALLVASASPLAAQQDSLARAFEHERRGNFTAAIPAFRAALKQRPGDANALLGLERSLQAVGRTAELPADLGPALAASPDVPALHAVALRTWNTLGQPDSVRRAVERWAAIEPTEETPYREWGQLLLQRKDRAGARAAYLQGRAKLGRPEALAPELAEVAALENDFAGSAREWLVAIRKLPGYRASALSFLRQAPEAQRKDVLAVLEKESSPDARRLDAELRARWGDPVGAFERLAGALPADQRQAVEALRLFGESLRGQQGAPARLAYARTLEAIADRSSGAQAGRLRLDAAQAYLDAGDRAAARRMLGGVLGGPEASAALTGQATSTLVRLLIEEGKLDEASAQLDASQGRMAADDLAELNRRVALGWAREGNLDRADALVARDSSVQGLATRGRLRLYRGDVKGAADLLQQAGPFAGTREDATARTALLALLQPIEADSLPALGTAFLALAKGDTAAAVAGFTRVAGQLPPAKGGAEARLMAGRLEAQAGHAREAEALLRTTAETKDGAAAPAALLELGRLYSRNGRGPEAVAVLEQLILDHPQSALVPQARRALDEARGAVPGGTPG
jgi:tetratricopeptide (TPR) repeat protein